MGTVELTIARGLRLHFYVNAGSHRPRYINPSRLTNKDKLLVHIIDQLSWNLPHLSESNLYCDSITLTSNTNETVEKVVKALIKIRGLKREELERMRKLSIEEVCKELVLKCIVEG